MQVYFRPQSESLRIYTGVVTLASVLLRFNILMVEWIRDTHRLKSSSLRLAVIRAVIIYGQPTILPLQSQICQLRHPLITTIARAEIETSGPIIREVLGIRATGASGESGWIEGVWRHGDVEGVSAGNLMDVC